MFARILLVAVMCGTAGAQEPQSDEDKLVFSIHQYREARAQYLTTRIAEAKRSKQGAEVRKFSARLKALEKSRLNLPQLYLNQLVIGQIGRLDGGHTGPNDNNHNRFKVLRIIDDKNMVITKDKGSFVNDFTEVVYHDDLYAWISGLPTTGIVDDQFVQLSQVFRVDSTTKFGRTTMFKLELFSIQDAEAVLTKHSSTK